MEDRTAATAGFVLVGVALAATLAGWIRTELAAALVGVALAGIALAPFALRRYGGLDRGTASIVAAAGSIGIAVASVYVAFRGGMGPGLVVAALAGLGGATFAYADWAGLDRSEIVEKSEATARAVAIGALGIVAIYAWAIVVALFVGLAAPDGLDQSSRTVLSTLASGAGTLTVVGLYLRWSGRSLSFLDARWPTLRGAAYAVGGILVILGGNVGIGILFQRVGIDSASHTVVETAQTAPTVLLVLIPLSYLVIAPGEELLYRNVVQKSLRESFSPVAGVVVASAIFAAVHLPAYSSPGASFAATLSTLGVVFVLALVLGAIYERTRNVVVPILAHGTFNAIAFAVTYGQFTGAFGG